LILLFCNISFGQERCIKILEVNEIKYYYVYKVFDVSVKDTITILSSKLDTEFEIIKLDINKFYKVETRLQSAIKISEEKYKFCKHAITIIEEVQISDKYKLPVLILNFKEVKYCEKC
jgi:hypothetical protein